MYSSLNGLTYNMSGQFAHCSDFSSPMRELRKILRNLQKYLRILYHRMHRISCPYNAKFCQNQHQFLPSLTICVPSLLIFTHP